MKLFHQTGLTYRYPRVKKCCDLELSDGSGRKIKELKMVVLPGINYVSLDNLPLLPKGMYLIKVMAGDKKTEGKLFK